MSKMRILLTGGSGFIAAHILGILLDHGHSVVTTVRNQDKADKIKEAHPNAGDRLSIVIVPELSDEGAFDKAVVSDPPFEAVIHTASPFHFNVTDIQKQLIDPAVMGTEGILKAIHKSAPTVKRVVITSSFAAIIHPAKGNWPGHIYSEEDWCPLNAQEALVNPLSGYRASKTFAEKAAWEFLEKEKPNFTIATINPPLVFGPIAHHLTSLGSVNTSNERIRDIILGKYKEAIAPTGTYLYVDARDVALAHVKAAELPEAANKRFFATAGIFSNSQLVDTIRKNFPEYQEKLPVPGTKGGELPEELYGYNNNRIKEVLGIQFKSFEQTIVDTVKSLQKVGDEKTNE